MVIFREQKKYEKNTADETLWSAVRNSRTVFKMGFAVDIGTTTIVVTAINPEQKKILGTLSHTNEQTKLGADVMMRIMHCMSGRRETLHNLVIKQVEEMAVQLWENENPKKVQGEQCYFFVVGNTTMCHLFLDKSVEGLAGYPFVPAYQGNYCCMGKKIGMEVFSEAEICVLSGITAHVGADALSVIGAEKLYQKDKVQLAVDLGTNAEIVLNQKGKISVCSTAAGPAFEGRGVSCGMAAKDGAIAEVRIASGNGNIILGVLEGKEPIGICSSGLVDLLAQLKRCKLLLKDGYLLRRSEAEKAGLPGELCNHLAVRKEQNAFLLCGEKEGKKEIYLLQSDIRSLQLAKAAIQAGIISILAAAQISLKEVDEFVVAGVLGSCVRQASAIGIGLFPEAVSEKIIFAGNAAGKGAVLGVLDTDFSEKLERLAQKISHIEIAQERGFQDCLMNAMDIQRWL